MHNIDEGWIRTFTGKQFWPLAPRAEDVDIRDIAHALSLKSRFGGHSKRFYSVAEHSIHIARWLATLDVPAATCLAGLMHDATEAYLPDVARPIKPGLAGFARVELQVWQAICERFHMDEDCGATLVKEADNRILANEMQQLMPCCDVAFRRLPITDTFGWAPSVAETEFLYSFWLFDGQQTGEDR